MSSDLQIGLNAVILAVTDEAPRVLTVSGGRRGPGAGGALEALPFGPLDPTADRTLELGLRRWVREQTGLTLGYVEQLYTFGDRDREVTAAGRGPRVLSIAYLALARERELAPGAESRWRDLYDYLPWEDGRAGRPASLEPVAVALEPWVDGPPGERLRRERADVSFGLGGSPWDGERVLDRYELLYEAGLVEEAARDVAAGLAPERRGSLPLPLGRAMVLDHRRMLATALGRVRGKLKYRPVVFELLPSTFTLLQLQRVVEALAGVRLHKQNFRRLVDRGGLVEGTGRLDEHTGGRPAELFRFRREVLRERRAPGVGLPSVKSG